jgi:hypothetical protein
MDVRLERFDRLSPYSASEVSNGTGGCPVNLNIPAPKIRPLYLIPKIQNFNFLENSHNDFNYIPVIYGYYLTK